MRVSWVSVALPVLCTILPLFISCASLTDKTGDTLGLELKKAAIEDKVAIREIQFKQGKNEPPNHLGLARRLTVKGFYDIALVQLDQAEKTDTKKYEVFYLKGLCYRGKKEYAKAISQFQQSLCLSPKYSYAHAGLAMTYDLLKEHARAIDCYEKAIEIDPGVSFFYNNMGVSFMINGEGKKAVECLEKGIAVNPGSRRLVHNLGLAYGMLGNNARAMGIFKKLDTPAAAYNNMGYVHWLKGDRDKAIEMYHKAIAADPGHQIAKKNLLKTQENRKGNPVHL